MGLQRYSRRYVMKKLIFGCAIAVGGLVLPQAYANFCYPDQCAPCCDVRGFEGFYVGGNLGVASNTYHRNDFDGFFGSATRSSTPTSYSGISTNVTAGVLAGYDLQCSNMLLGVVGDWSWTNLRRNTTELPDVAAPNYQDRNRVRWFSTIRARAGVTLCDALFYITGGAAVTKINRHHDGTLAADSAFFRECRTRWGWTGGVGSEFMLGCNWSVGAEVLFCQFSEQRRTFTDPSTSDRYSFGASDSLWVGRVTLNYRFGDLCSCFF